MNFTFFDGHDELRQSLIQSISQSMLLFQEQAHNREIEVLAMVPKINHMRCSNIQHEKLTARTQYNSQEINKPFVLHCALITSSKDVTFQPLSVCLFAV